MRMRMVADLLFVIILVKSLEACSHNEVSCKDGKCFPGSFWCDNIQDCADGLDEDIRVCSQPLAIRMSNTSSARSRVEVRIKGRWGTLCKEQIGNKEAQVMCRMAGLKGGQVTTLPYSSNQQLPIWQASVKCQGSEENLNQCSDLKWKLSYCSHADDLALQCDKLEEKSGRNLKDILPRDCGGHGRVKRVINGEDAKTEEVPWQASIRIREGREGKHVCGGVIISTDLILTAAHCVDTTPMVVLRVRVGDTNQVYGQNEPQQQEFRIEKLVVHPDYKLVNRAFNDIAILKIRPNNGSTIRFGSSVQPACLPTAQTQYTDGKLCTISGWGKTAYKALEASAHLQIAHIPLISDERCNTRNVHRGLVKKGMFCAGLEGSFGQPSTCHGDSGGPMTCTDNNREVVYGLTSWAIKCANGKRPGVYVKVKYYLPWIQRVIRNLT